MTHLRAEARGVAGTSRAVVDQPRQRGGLGGHQLARLQVAGQRAGQRRLVRRRAGHVVTQVGQHGEQLVELGVGRAQQLAHPAFAVEHDLDAQRDGLWLQLHRRDDAEHLRQGLDADLAAQQRALQRRPREGLLQQLDRVDHQEAAVRAVQRAALDEPEVRQQGPEACDVVDAPYQVLVGRQVGLDDVRNAAGRGIQHEVDLVAGQLAGSALALALARLGLLAGAEVVGVLDDVGAHRVEVAAHRGLRDVAHLGLVDRVVHRQQRHRAVQVAHGLGVLLAHPHVRSQGAQQLVLDLAHRLLQLGPTRLGQGLEHLRRHDLAVLLRGEGEAHGRADHRQPAPAGLAGDLRQGLVGSLLEVGIQSLGLGRVFVGLEHRRDQRAQVTDELAHVGAQLRPHARWQLQCFRLVRALEVVHVDPVAALDAVAGHVCIDGAAHQVAPARAGRAHHEQVEALVGRRNRQLHRGAGAFLADQAGGDARAVVVHVGQLCRVAAAGELGGTEGAAGHGSVVSLEASWPPWRQARAGGQRACRPLPADPRWHASAGGRGVFGAGQGRADECRGWAGVDSGTTRSRAGEGSP